MGMQGDGDGGSRGLAGIFNCLKQELIVRSLPCLHMVQQNPALSLLIQLCCQCWGWPWFLSMQREDWFAMGKGQLLLQPGAVLAARTLHVSNNMVPVVGSAKGWAGSWPASVPWQRTSWCGLCSISSPSSVLSWQVVLGAGTSKAAAGPSVWAEERSTHVQRSENQRCLRHCINPRTMLIHTPLNRSRYGLTLPAAAVAVKGQGCHREEGSSGMADAGI